MKRPISDRARQLSTELERSFAQDTELAGQLDNAHRPLRNANDRLWSGLHPDGLRALDGDHPRSEEPRLATAGHRRPQALDTSDAVGALQEAHWQIHRSTRARCDHQRVAEDRRRLAADIGEMVRTFADELLAAGWSHQEARNANIREFAGSGQELSPMIDPDDDEEILARPRDRAERCELRLGHLGFGGSPRRQIRVSPERRATSIDTSIEGARARRNARHVQALVSLPGAPRDGQAADS